MKLYWFLVIIFSMNTSFASTHSQMIYQYKNQYNVTEFTDIADSEKTLIQKFEIISTSLEQHEAINRSLDKIRAYNKDFNKRYYANKKRQYEAAKRNAERKKLEKKQADAAHARDISKLNRHDRNRHMRRDAIRGNKGKPHSY